MSFIGDILTCLGGPTFELTFCVRSETRRGCKRLRGLADPLGVDCPFIQRGRDLRCKAKDLSDQDVSRQESGTTYNGQLYYADHQKGFRQGYQWDAKWAGEVHQFPKLVTTEYKYRSFVRSF